jgi:Holliday junction resolvase
MKMRLRRESEVQAKKMKELQEDGFYVIKLVSTNKNGIPDLIAIKPTGEILFVEVKAAKGRLSKLQEYRIKELRDKGFNVEVYTDAEDK